MSTDTFGKFGNVICCDDIRQEINNKFFFIGTYTSDIVVSALPATLYLRLFVQYQAPLVGDQKLDFIWQLEGTELVVLEGAVSQWDVTKMINMSLPPAPLHIDREGEVTVVARLASGETKEVYRTSVAVSETPIPMI